MLRYLILGAALPSVLMAQGACAPLTGASAWFTFDEPMFQAKGPASPQNITGLVGKALRFDGKKQYWESPPGLEGINFGEEDFSIELWVRTTSKTGTHIIADKRNTVPTGYQFYVYQGHPGFQMAHGDYPNAVDQITNIADNKWHHLAAAAKRLPQQKFRLYVDGVERAQSHRPALLANLDVSQPLWLGRHHPNVLVPRDDIDFAGDLDELTFYHRALTAPEILSIYRAGAKGKCRPR